MKYTVEILYPIVPDFTLDGSYPFNQREIIVSEINSILKSGLVELPEFIKQTKSNVTIEEFKPMTLEQWSLPDRQCLKFEIVVEVDLSLFEWIKVEAGGKETRITDKKALMSNMPHALRDALGTSLFELLILSQLARPGSLKIRDGICIVNGQRLVQTCRSTNNFREYMQDQEKRQYPPIEYIELKPFYSWIIENHLLFPMHPKNSYQKAINNLSYVHGEDNEISRFIYQMRILEGIYTKENNNQITEQLNTKIPLFLGSIQAFKKQIKEMYDIRSKFLHGTSVAVPFHKTHQVDFDYLSSFDHAVAVASSTSILLAISTLQKMYLNDFVELDFNYHVSGKKGNAE